MSKPPFDPVRASFWLLAAVLGVQCTVVLSSAAVCAYWTEAIVEGRVSCSRVMDHMYELLVGALAAALAFAGGPRRK
jgi:threonine/homoserine/homoserine lactone efflux protein